MFDIDRIIVAFDKGLRTVFAPAQTVRAVPGSERPEPSMEKDERERAAALMRVNHAGEICAQALYQGQALTARNVAAREALDRAAQEETEHIAWTERRIAELGGRKSVLGPLWYAGSLAMGAAAGLAGDRWNLGFLAETERQVGHHLQSHLDRLPLHDEKSRAIVAQMYTDEVGHADMARSLGGAELPQPVQLAMKLNGKVMTGTSYWV